MYLIPIKYHGLNYPKGIHPKIIEVAGHFDTVPLKDRKISKNIKISLHTEYSAKDRHMKSIRSSVLKTSLRKWWGKQVPDLWANIQWTKDFANFILDLVKEYEEQIEIIEIHPPIPRKYNWNTFIINYQTFYSIVKQKLLNAQILIENRNGFLLSGVCDFQILSSIIDKSKIDLGLIIDFPQLLNYEKAKDCENKLNSVMQQINNFKHNVKAFHLWGQVGRRSHAGDINDYFNNDEILINNFYSNLANIFLNKNQKYYFIPEINSGNENKTKNQCLYNIVQQLKNTGFKFI